MSDEPGQQHDEAPAPEPAAPEPTAVAEPAAAPGPAPAPDAKHVEPLSPPPRPEHEARETFQPLLYAKIAALLFFIAYAIAFVVGNRRSISVDFVFATANVSLIWTILLLLAVGIVGGMLLSQLYRHRGRQQLRKQGDAVPDLGGRHKAERKPGGAPPSA